MCFSEKMQWIRAEGEMILYAAWYKPEQPAEEEAEEKPAAPPAKPKKNNTERCIPYEVLDVEKNE